MDGQVSSPAPPDLLTRTCHDRRRHRLPASPRRPARAARPTHPARPGSILVALAHTFLAACAVVCAAPYLPPMTFSLRPQPGPWEDFACSPLGVPHRAV